MNRILIKGLAVALAASGLIGSAGAATYYVDASRPDDTGDGQSWATAKKTIQAGVDLGTLTNDVIMVTNGVYDVGGRTNYPAGTVLTNRVVITNAVIVQAVSTNPAHTLIVGAADTRGGAASNGPSAIRCVYIASGMLSGFTITNGYTLAVASFASGGGGGVYSEGGVVSNCLIIGNRAGYRAGASYGGTFKKCEIVANGADGANNVAAMAYSALYGCFVHDNSANYTLNNCALYDGCVVSNNAGSYGIVSGGTAYDTLIVKNNCSAGGTAEGSTLYRCTISGNTSYKAGGLSGGTAYNCLIMNNTATDPNAGRAGGGVADSKLYNCTVVSNHVSGTSPYPGIRLYSSANFVSNCIVYYNGKGGTNNWGKNTYDGYTGSTTNIAYSCITPTNGLSDPGNITNAPSFKNMSVSDYRLSGSSPCIDTGINQNWMTNAVDLDGQQRIRNDCVDMGAYEYIMRQGIVFSIGGR